MVILPRRPNQPSDPARSLRPKHVARDTVDFPVFGERAGEAEQLLLPRDDGCSYPFDLASGEVVPLASEDGWAVDLVETPIVLELPVDTEAP